MSARPLDITTRQARALLKAANAEGGAVDVKMGATVIRLIPAVVLAREGRPAEPVDPKPKGHL